MAELSLFPVFDYEKYRGVFAENSDYTFGFVSSTDDTYYKLICENGVLKESKERKGGEWNFENDNLLIKRNLKISGADRLYGPNGLACNDAKLGLYVLWSSPESYQRGVFDLGVINNTSQEQSLSLDDKLAKGSFRGKITLSTFLYINAPGKPQQHEEHLANTKGTVIGEVDQMTIFVDGFASSINIVYKEIPNSALWDVVIAWEQPDVELFTETVCIQINSKSPFFKFVNNTNTEFFDPNMFREILASAFCQMIEKYREYDPDFIKLDANIPGSVSHVIQHFRNVLGVDLSSLSTVSKTLRKALEKNSIIK